MKTGRRLRSYTVHNGVSSVTYSYIYIYIYINILVVIANVNVMYGIFECLQYGD